jgi:phosphoesterase RecJ-like protein
MWPSIINLIDQAQNVVITTHTNPDLDALGCELALDEFLRSRGKQTLILNSDKTPDLFRFVDPEHRVRVFSPRRHHRAISQADLIFVLDASGGLNRIGRVGEALSTTNATLVRIDHHPDPTGFAQVEVVDTDASATAELIFDLITKAGSDITPTIARLLYLAILTDAGSFRYPKTSPRTHRIAARLLEAGADPTQLYSLVYEQYPLNQVRLKGYVLNSLQVSDNGQIAWCMIDQSTLKAFDASPADLNGFPGLGMIVRDVRVSVLCVEMPKGTVKVSLRSDGSVLVNGLAARWGGGGHGSAAGATITGTLEEVTKVIVSAIEDLLVD